MKMPTINKTMITTVVVTLGVLWAIHNVGALEKVKDFMNFDQ